VSLEIDDWEERAKIVVDKAKAMIRPPRKKTKKKDVSDGGGVWWVCRWRKRKKGQSSEMGTTCRRRPWMVKNNCTKDASNFKFKHFFKYIIPLIPPVSGDVVTATGTERLDSPPTQLSVIPSSSPLNLTVAVPNSTLTSARVEEAMWEAAFADCASCEDATHPTARSFVSVVVDIFI